MTDITPTAAKPPLPRHPRIHKGLRFWVEMSQDGDEWQLSLELEGLDISGTVHIPFRRWPPQEWLNEAIDGAISGWASEHWKTIQSVIDENALERRQAHEHWATRGAHGREIRR